ncbi:MAG TPA: sulfotransferase domain-containing protein [Chthonomonadaceae bacterium]|nr:sulfotransferase domain-containing protein [Chthonomonadaceae bacterium]
MARNRNDWRRFTETYDLTIQQRIASYEGRRTLSDRIQSRLARLKFQFLPYYGGGPPKWRLWLRRTFGGERVLPDFVCQGTVKSGTSELCTYLLQHPCILPPLSKEIQSLNPAEWRPYYPTVREKEQVEKEQGKALSGYFLPLFNSLTLIENYHAARPDGKVILMLRNPVDRAYSHYKWDLFLGGKRLAQRPYYATFAAYVDKALDLFPSTPFFSYCGMPLLQAGTYVKSVELWIEHFGRENVFILRAEDFFQDIPSTMCDIHQFLGIPPVKPEIHPIVNQNPIKPPPFEPETRVKLQEFYRPWNEKLYALLERDMEWE